MDVDHCAHHWANTSGRVLHCADCGILWPGDPSFPPVPWRRALGFIDTSKAKEDE